MSYFAVCYGHAVRYEQAATPEEACRLAFGVTDTPGFPPWLTVEKMPRSPRGIGHKRLTEFLRPLAVKHFRRTGSVLSGWEREPGIHGVHWARCNLCHIPKLTEPFSAGIDAEEGALCSECEQKYYTLSKDDQEYLSITQMRARLGITVQ